MIYYENWCIPERTRHNCAICGVETKKGMTCGYHAQARRKHKREARKYRIEKLTEMICELVDEAREA